MQHNLPELRGIRGKPFVGRAVRVDFAPQLEVEVEVLDPETRALVEAGRITGASLEFVPLESRAQKVGSQESEVYYRLASEPELAGLALTDLPAVPGAEVLEIRAEVLAPWQFAVVDPAVFEARSLTDAARLMWFPHHDARTHAVDPGLLERALADLEAGRFEVPATATLSREEVARRARAHLERHMALGIGMRTTEENMEVSNPLRYVYNSRYIRRLADRKIVSNPLRYVYNRIAAAPQPARAGVSNPLRYVYNDTGTSRAMQAVLVFQTLLGTSITVSSRVPAIPAMSVSNPLRYVYNLDELAQQGFQLGVSNPLRYVYNLGWRRRMRQVSAPFQTLLGTSITLLGAR